MIAMYFYEKRFDLAIAWKQFRALGAPKDAGEAQQQKDTKNNEIRNGVRIHFSHRDPADALEGAHPDLHRNIDSNLRLHPPCPKPLPCAFML